SPCRGMRAVSADADTPFRPLALEEGFMRQRIVGGTLALALMVAWLVPSLFQTAEAETLVPAAGAWLGAYVGHKSTSPLTLYEGVLAFEQSIGRRLNIDAHNHAWA